MVEKEGSKRGFLISIVGGVIGLLIGLAIFGYIILELSKVGFVRGDPAERTTFLYILGGALYFSVISIWIIYLSIWIKNPEKMKKAATTNAVLAIITVNFIALIGSILTFIDFRKGKVVEIVKKKIERGALQKSKKKGFFESLFGKKEEEEKPEDQIKILGGGPI